MSSRLGGPTMGLLGAYLSMAMLLLAWSDMMLTLGLAIVGANAIWLSTDLCAWLPPIQDFKCL